jgi:hypothetical protein
VIVLIALGACLPPAGCSFGGDEPAERVEQPTLLSAARVERLPAGSPERALFEWWRAMQFDDAAAGAHFYAAGAAVTGEQLDRQLGVARAAFRARPGLVDVSRQSERATVAVLLEQRAVAPNGRVDIKRTPRAFDLIREKGRWRLADNAYLERAVRDQRALARALRKQGGSQQ